MCIRDRANIIQARMEEIIEHIHYEIKNSGYENKLICGIVVTGGGSQLKHITQLMEYVTGMDTRIGYPNEHLAPNNANEITSPMYATSVGLVIKGFEAINKNKDTRDEIVGHSDNKKSGFFDRLLHAGHKFLEDSEK